MQKLAIAVSNNVSFQNFPKDRVVVKLSEAEMTETSVVLMSVEDAEVGELDRIEAYGFGIPIFIFVERGRYVPDELIGRCMGVVNDDPVEEAYFVRQLVDAATSYEEKILPPFFRSLRRYVSTANEQFDCPGHQGGAFFRRHPAGREFTNFFGETIFRADLCNADVDMGDLLIHEGAAAEAEKHAAKVFNADKTYFVLNGTSTSNKVVLSSLLTLTATTTNPVIRERWCLPVLVRCIWKRRAIRMGLSAALMMRALTRRSCAAAWLRLRPKRPMRRDPSAAP